VPPASDQSDGVMDGDPAGPASAVAEHRRRESSAIRRCWCELDYLVR
jgi:hypothetical protein